MQNDQTFRDFLKKSDPNEIKLLIEKLKAIGDEEIDELISFLSMLA